LHPPGAIRTRGCGEEQIPVPNLPTAFCFGLTLYENIPAQSRKLKPTTLIFLLFILVTGLIYSSYNDSNVPGVLSKEWCPSARSGRLNALESTSRLIIKFFRQEKLLSIDIDRNGTLPAKVQVKSGQTVVLNIDIDTGIR
jgi:hypothetical protein